MTGPGEPVLAIEGLSVVFGPAAVLDGLDLCARAGEVTVVLGASGSGKSTLLRAVLGLVAAPGLVDARLFDLTGPDGPVDLRRLTGRDWQRVRGRLVGAVFQDSALALSPLRRVGSLLVEAAGEPLTPLQLQQRLRACGFVDPEPVLGQRGYELSGGMAQRVGMALATARSPRLLVADEPTTALDGLARAEITRRLRDFADAGGAVVVTTHDVSVAAAIADDVVVLEGGRRVEHGPARQVLGTPTHPASRRLVTHVPWSLPAAEHRRLDRGQPPALRLRGLAKTYGRPVLRGVDLDVAPGEIVGVAGLSGAGKSTLVRCVLGLEQPEAGTVQAAGTSPEVIGWRRFRRHVQLVNQDPRASLNPWRTAAEAVADPMRYHRIGTRSSQRRRASELLAAVGLGGYDARYPLQLSTGQCQRVAIARALAVEPAVIVADEPVSALDTHTQAEVVALLRQVVLDTGAAAVVVSHGIHVLERLCDRVAVLDGGVLVSDQAAADIRRSHVHPTATALVACYPPDPLDTSRSYA